MLFRKMLRDIKTNKAQFIAIFLMIYLGVFIFTGVNSEWNGMLVNSNDFYRETNLADVVVYGNHFEKNDLYKLIKNNDINNVERRTSLNVNVKNQKKKKIELYLLETNAISKMKLMQGEPYAEDIDGIWIDQTYAKNNHIEVNDTFEIETNGISFKKIVKGIVLHPELVYSSSDENLFPNHKNHGYAMISSKYFPYLAQVPFTQLIIDTNKPIEMEQIVSDTLKSNQLTFIQRKDLVSYAMLQDEITQHRAFGQVFPIVFLLIAVLTTLTTVSKLIMNQRLQCGILKALGFKNRKIMLHYFSHIIFITTLGAILGFISGPLIVPSLIYPMMKALFILPEWNAVPLENNVIMVIGSILICFIVAYLVGHKQLKEKPSTMLRPITHKFKKGKEHKSKLWNKLNFYSQWNIRDVFRNKIRSLIAMVGVCGCMGLMLCAFGMQDSMNHMMYMMFDKLQTYEMKAQVNEQVDVEKIKNLMDGSAVFETSIELKQNNTKKTGSLTVQEDTRYLKLENQDRNLTELPKEGIALSYKMANYFDLKIGDKIQWRIMGNQDWVYSKVKTIIHTPVSQGITMSKKEYLKTNLPFTPTSIVGNKVSLKKEKGVQSSQFLQEDIAKSMDSMMEGMNLMISVLILGAVVLGVVVLYNIGTFSYLEKTREMATLKVLGFKNIQVKKLLRQQNFWLTLVGILTGIPFGYVLIYTVISTIGDSMDMSITINLLTYSACSLSTIIVSVLVMRIVSRKVKKIDMVSALKAIE